MSYKSHQIQKHKFSVTCPVTLFLETTPGQPEHEKYCIDVSQPKLMRFLWKPPRAHPSMKSNVPTFHNPDALYAKTEVQRNLSRCPFG
jgi:hypothetical protein